MIFGELSDLDCFRAFLGSYLRGKTKFKDVIDEILLEAYEFKVGIKTIYTVSSKNLNVVLFLKDEIPEVLKESGHTEDDYKLILSETEQEFKSFKTSKLFKNQSAKQKVLEEFCKKIIKEQEDCPKEFIDIVNEEFWNII